MEQVEWKQSPTNFHKANAQKCYEEMGENPTPESVLEIAKNPESELHKCFDWDDTSAANKFRLIQARAVIVNLVIKGTEKTDNPVRALQITTEKSVYAPTKTFLVNVDEHMALIARAKAELKAIRNRYKQISELESVFEAIDAI